MTNLRRTLLPPLMTLAVLCLWAVAGLAQEQSAVGGPYVEINSQQWTPQHPPMRMAGVVLVPVRDFAAVVGASLAWDAATRMVKLSRGDASAQLWVGRTIAVVNNEPRALAVAPGIFNDTLYAPLDVLVETFGGQVQWDADRETAVVTLGGATYTQVSGTLLQAYAGPPPALLIFDTDTGRYRAIALNDATQLMAGPADQRPAPAKLSDLRPGDLVRVYLDDQGRAVRVVAQYAVVEGAVEGVEGRDILIGGRIVRLLDTADIVDAAGKPASPDAIGPGARIRARINPQTGQTAQVVVLRAAAAARPEIRVVGIIDRKPAYKAGSTVRVRLIGTPGARATVTIAGVVRDLPLREVRPGYYEATVALDIPRGQEKKVYLVGNLQVGGTLLSYETFRFWIDGRPPQFASPRPNPNSTVDRRRPTISFDVIDHGSGVDFDSVRMWLDKKEVTRHLTRAANHCTYHPDDDLAPGVHTVKVRASDKAGLTNSYSWSFRVIPARGQKIVAVKHNATGPLGLGEVLRVNVVTVEQGRCWATVGGLTIDLKKQSASKRGTLVYAGTHTVQKSDRIVNAELVAHFVDKTGRQYTMKADVPVTLRGDWPAGVLIVSPKSSEKISGPFRIQGRAKPGSTVRVIVRYYKKRLVIFQGELTRRTVTANNSGWWQTDAIDPRVALLGMADTYTITAELIVGGKVKARAKRVLESK